MEPHIAKMNLWDVRNSIADLLALETEEYELNFDEREELRQLRQRAEHLERAEIERLKTLARQT